MKRQIEPRPRYRAECDLRECHEHLAPREEYPTLRDCPYFSGVRVFCSVDHRDEYEMRIVLVKTKPRWTREERPPGVPYDPMTR